MKKHCFVMMFALSGLTFSANSQTLVINELMQSNVTTLFAEEEFPDSWVELYNPSDEDVALKGYALGDSEKFSKAWVFDTEDVVPAKSYIVIYCDKEENGLHTDFRVDSGKAEIYLFDAEENVIDQISFKKMPAPDVAYGRETDNSATWGYMLTPTPGESNTGGITETILPQPVFSQAGGVKTKALSLTISLPYEDLPDDVKLCVTTNGSEPTLADAVNVPYVMNIEETTVVRATLVSAEAVSVKPLTHSYIFHPRQTDLPIVSIVTENDYFYAEGTGLFTVPIDDNQNIKTDYRRPINIELFESDAPEAVFNQIGETRLQGGYTRRYEQRSLAVYANKRFGTKRYEAAMWNDKPEVEKSKSFLLRNGGNDFHKARIRDAFIQTLFGLNVENLDWQAYEPCICYINGEYRGIYDIRERTNEDWVEANYDGLEDICMIENWTEVKAGDISDYWQFEKIYNDENCTYEDLDANMDVDEFLTMVMAETYAVNTDYPHNNIVMWKDLENAGKWRWLLKDIDYMAYNAYDYDYFKHLYDLCVPGNHPDSYTPQRVRIFTLALELPQTREMLLDKFTVYMGDFMQADVIKPMLDNYKAEVEDEYIHHLGVYFSQPETYFQTWESEYDYIYEWCQDRTEFMYDYLSDYFELGSPVPTTIVCNKNDLSVNDIRLTQDTFNGKFFAGREMKLESSNENVVYKVEIINTDHTETTYTIEQKDMAITLDEEAESLKITVTDPTSVESVTDEAKVGIFVNGRELTVSSTCGINAIEVYDLSGCKVALVEDVNSQSDAITLPAGGVYIAKVILADGNVEVKKVIAD